MTVDAAKKTRVVVTDTLEKAAEKTGDAASATGKAMSSKSQRIGKFSVDVTENVAGQTYEGGKWVTVTAWDGTKWASKRVWYATKKTGEAVTGDNDGKKP